MLARSRPTSRLNRVHRALVTAFSLAVGASAVHALPTTFNYTGAFQTFIVPTTGAYDIIAFGAQGGRGDAAGGFGAEVGSIFTLNAGDVLRIAVGGQGGNSTAGAYGAGGGGGTFIYNQTTSTLLEVAGGGGGSYTSGGGMGLATFGGSGFGGTGTFVIGGGGGGFTSAGAGGGVGGGAYPTLTGGNKGFINSGVGGWGGGGGGGGYGGGGGGGFNGGNGVQNGSGTGGTSFSAGAVHVQVSGFRAGNGMVTIESLGVPEPGTFGMAALGGLVVAAIARRGRRTPADTGAGHGEGLAARTASAGLPCPPTGAMPPDPRCAT